MDRGNIIAIPKTLHIGLVSHRVQKNDGQGRVNYEVASAALDRGHRVTMLAAHCAPEIARHPRAHWVQLSNDHLPTQMLRNLSFANSTARWLRNNRRDIDVLQGNGFTTWEACDVVAAHFVHGAWRRNRYYPFDKNWTSPYKTYQRAFTSLNQRWERGAFTKAKVIVAVSERVAEELRSIKIPAEKIHVIYNGVDTDEFCPGQSERFFFNLPENVKLALFVGDLKTTRKNLETVFKALQRLPDLHLAVGGRTEGSPYPKLAESLGVEERVYFLGHVSEMPKLMRSVDCFVFPTRYDPLGLVILEAMSAGLPVITSVNAGGAELLGNAGRIMENPDDVQLLTRLLSELLARSASSTELGKKARERALANRWEVMATAYLELYEQVAAH